MYIQFIWDKAKCSSNLRDRGIDFADDQCVFDGLTYTYEDDRLAYGERRLLTLGLLAGVAVSIAHAETNGSIRVISFRRATSHETEVFFAYNKG